MRACACACDIYNIHTHTRTHTHIYMRACACACVRVRARARACVRVRVRVRAREYHSASHLTQPVRNRPDALCPTSAHTNHTCDRRTHEPHMYRAAMPPIIPATHRHIPRYVPRYTPIFIATCPPPSPTPHAPGCTDKDKTGTKT